MCVRLRAVSHVYLYCRTTFRFQGRGVALVYIERALHRERELYMYVCVTHSIFIRSSTYIHTAIKL